MSFIDFGSKKYTTATPFRKKTEIIKDNPNDKIYTPEETAKYIIEKINSKYNISGKILDPCKGSGAFYNNFPTNCQKDYCEIDENKDFFKYNEKVDWIISNPPYSIFEDFLKHSMELTNNIVYLIPVNKIVSSARRIADLYKFGGIPYMLMLTSAETKFPFGFGTSAIYIKKDYRGSIDIELSPIFKKSYNINE